MDEQWLADEKHRRLQELRAKYPKPEPVREYGPETYSTYVELILRFDFKAKSQEEAERLAFQWMWEKSAGASDHLMKTFARDGLRSVGAAWPVVKKPWQEDDEGDDSVGTDGVWIA